MTEPYDPDKVNAELYGEGKASPTSTPIEVRREAQPLGQDDAIILKNTKDEFDRSPVPTAVYDTKVEKSEFDFDPKGKPRISLQFRISGPSQINRVVFMKLAPRSNEFAPIMLKKLLSRAQKPDAKGDYHSLIEYVDVNKPFNEKEFCDKAIAIGAECRLNVGIGKPYKNQAGDMVTPNNVKDILLPSTGTKFMQ